MIIYSMLKRKKLIKQEKISKIEGERNGRDNNSGRYGDFSDTYK